jgi:hypothetical protein
MGYQQMDHRFVGVIFSVFNKQEASKVSHLCYMLAHFLIYGKKGGNNFSRKNYFLEMFVAFPFALNSL